MTHQLSVIAATRPDPHHQDNIDRLPLMQVFKSDLAQAEGWDVFDCGLREDGSPRIEIQRIDCPEEGKPVFAGDQEAWRHVVTRAWARSALHISALQMINPIDRMLVEASFGCWPGQPE